MGKLLFFSIIFLLGIYARWLGVAGELWFDEIVSINEVQKLSSALAIFSGPLFDNNHALNSLWLFHLETCASPMRSRLVSLIASIVLAGLVLSVSVFRNSIQKYFFSLFILFSYLVVLYGTEARGYSSMLLFLFVSYLCGVRAAQSTSLVNLLGFHVSAVLALLSHSSAATFLFPFAIYLCLVSFRLGRLKQGALVAIPQIICGTLYYCLFIHGLPAGSGTFRPEIEVAINTLSMVYGGGMLSPALILKPAGSAFPTNEVVLFMATLTAAICLFETVRKLKHQRDEGIFFLLGIFIVPCAIIALGPRVLYERYFLGSVLICYLAFSSFFAHLWVKSLWGKFLGSVLVILFLALNGGLIQALGANHRGEYEKVADYLEQNSVGDSTTLESDHTVRNATVLDYYLRCSGSSLQVEYLKASENSGIMPEWYLSHSQDLHEVPEQKVSRNDQVYSLVQVSNASPLSGWRWFLYRGAK